MKLHLLSLLFLFYDHDLDHTFHISPLVDTTHPSTFGNFFDSFTSFSSPSLPHNNASSSHFLLSSHSKHVKIVRRSMRTKQAPSNLKYYDYSKKPFTLVHTLGTILSYDHLPQ